MAEWIRREEALNIVLNTSGDYATAYCELRKLPAVDVEPVKHGRNEHEKYSSTDEFRCSECGIHLEDWVCFKYEDEYNFDCCEFEIRYCPNCGAKMEGEENGA